MGRYFNVGEIAGSGDEESRMKNILMWVHDNFRYDGSKYYEGERNAIALYEYYKETGNGINCRMMATAANELYLAAGFHSRFITCMPKDSLDSECHVINAVWSPEKNKWIWMDPSFGAYVTDIEDNLLSIAEVRDNLIHGRLMKLNEGRKVASGIRRSYYLERYMAKNLYWFGCDTYYGFNTESSGRPTRNISLTPQGFTVWESQARWYPYDTHNAGLFWQAPLELD